MSADLIEAVVLAKHGSGGLLNQLSHQFLLIIAGAGGPFARLPVYQGGKWLGEYGTKSHGRLNKDYKGEYHSELNKTAVVLYLRKTEKWQV